MLRLVALLPLLDPLATLLAPRGTRRVDCCRFGLLPASRRDHRVVVALDRDKHEELLLRDQVIATRVRVEHIPSVVARRLFVELHQQRIDVVEDKEAVAINVGTLKRAAEEGDLPRV